MWKWQLLEQNGLWRPSILSHTHGHAPGAISQFSRSCRTGHTAPEGRDIHWDNLLASFFLWAQSPAAESRRCGRAVRGEGSLPVSQPQEPWNCRPLPAERQQEILVEEDKETAVVTHVGVVPPAPEPLSWLCLGKTCQLCWKWSFFPGQTPPQTPVLLAAWLF